MLLVMVAAIFSGEAPQHAEESTEPAPQVRICRDHERRTGTRIRSGRVCKTQEQWQADDAERERAPTTMRIGDRRDTTTNTPQ